jgi:hypothetical protein
MKEFTVTHPAFGNIQINRVQGHAALYDSPLRHQNFISIRIQTAESQRSRACSWHLPRKEIVEVLLSETQFAQAITGDWHNGCALHPETLPRSGHW